MRRCKTISALLALAVLLNATAMGAVSIASAAEDDFVPIRYTESFDQNVFEAEGEETTGAWVVEHPGSGNNAGFTAEKPISRGGVLRMEAGMSAQFNWQELDGFVFDASKTYTLTFNVKVTDFGDDQGIRDAWKRELYLAPGGYYNQIELRSDRGDQAIRTGNTYVGDDGYAKDTVYGVQVVWEPAAATVTSTLLLGDTVISTGSRSDSIYSNADSQFSNWVMRCEDGAIEITQFAYTDGTNRYEQGFEEDIFTEYVKPEADGIWAAESVVKPDARAPKVVDGVLTFTERESAAFYWQKVPGVGKYDAQTNYIFEFDLTVTDGGDGSNWNGADHTRAIYTAMGGYFNQIELPTKNNQVRAGDTYRTCTSEYLNKPLHAKLVWEGTSITTTIFDEGGNILITGSRTHSDFTSMTKNNASMTYLVLRCEDGAFEIDNFSFRTERVENTLSTKLEMKEGMSTVFTCTVDCNSDARTALKLNNTEIFSIANKELKLCGSVVGGDYGLGNYGLKITLNKEQMLLLVEVTLPGGGILRRGTYAVIDQTATEFAVGLFATSAEAIKDVAVTHTVNIENQYKLETKEPEYVGFGANVFNLVTSFDDARTTRSFAFTARERYAKDDTMAVKYRAKGETEWKIVDAVKEADNDSANNFYKADLIGLLPGTEYEYKIGKKAGTSESDDWSTLYTFKTAAEEVKEFSFVALGDTQGVSWNGSTEGTKGFMYAKAAYEAAIKEVPDAAFILHTGDIVETGNNANQWGMFFKALGNIGASVPHFAAIGNHDIMKLDNNHFYFDYHFNHPNNGGSDQLDMSKLNRLSNVHLQAIVKSADETFYSYDYGNAHFIVLNSGNYTPEDQKILEAQRNWLEADLKANTDAQWTIITVHEPVYHRLGGTESRPWLYDLIERYNVDLVIQGHSHLVTRTYPMKNGEIVSKESLDLIKKGSGTVYTTVGATAYNHDSMGNPNVEECAIIATPHSAQATYTVVNVTEACIVMTVKQLNGLVVDTFTILDESVQPEQPPITTTEDAQTPEVSGTAASPQSPDGFDPLPLILVGAVIAVGVAAVLVIVLLKKKKK